MAKNNVASAATLAALVTPLVLDVRDPNEVEAGKGGPPKLIEGSINVPLNFDGVGQAERETTAEEFSLKLKEAGVTLPADKSSAIITHCGSGGRGGRAQALLQSLGFTNVHNGGGPSNIAVSFSLNDDM